MIINYIGKFNPAELLKINKVDKPISNTYIESVKSDNKKGKIINSLVRKSKMTPTEAKQAVLSMNEPKQKRNTKK